MKYTEEHIDAYLRGEMTVEEKAAFEAEMEQDSALAHEVNMMHLLIGGLKDRKEKLDSITAWQKEAEHKAMTRVAVRRPWVPWVTAFSAAAALVTGVFLFQPTYQSPTEVTPTPRTPQEMTSPNMRGPNISFKGNPNGEKNRSEALKAIDREIAETERLLNESRRIREEADYNVQKYQYALQELKKKRDEIRKAQDTK